MTGRSIPAQGGVTDDPIRIGTMLYTLVEPHRGHQVAYNRWYERDHFYAGCQIGAYNFAGARFVSTAPLKGLRYPTGDGALVADPSIGSYLGIYFYLRVIQFMFMSPDAAVADPGRMRRFALGASLACLAAAVLVAVFPGWVIARF